MSNVLSTIDHRPFALPAGSWRMSQRWNDLLFAHWPISVEAMARVVPPSLEVDTHDGWAWAGVVPFWMDRVRTRAVGAASFGVPGTASFAELNLRTYVRSRVTGQRGVFFFSLDAASPMAVIGARVLFGLPYYWASMQRSGSPEAGIAYASRRLFTRRSVQFKASYRALGPIEPTLAGSLEHFLTERYCLFTARGARVSVGHIHHLPWPLERAEAEIERNELPGAHGLVLPDRPPVLHFARELEVYVWGLARDASPQ